MRPGRVKRPGGRRRGPSRRDVLRAAAGVALGTIAGAASGQEPEPASRPAPAASSSDSRPWWLGPRYPRSRVVEIQDARVLVDGRADDVILADLIDLGLRVLTGLPTATEALQHILGPARRIAVKFNHVDAEQIGTNEAVARALAAALATAGYGPDTLMLVEAPSGLAGELNKASPPSGWGPAIRVGGRLEELANWVYESDAIINVPFLKAHTIAGMSGAMKNISYAAIRHPARYHDSGCSPYIGEVIANKELSSRLKLTIVTALRVLVDPGCREKPSTLADVGRLLFGFDPVALDTVGLEVLLRLRRDLGITSRLQAPSVAAAGELGAGRCAAYGIDRLPAALGS